MRALIGLDDLPGGIRRVADRLRDCEERVARAAERGGRTGNDAKILVVSKYVDEDVLHGLYDLGVRDFGENRIQVLEARRAAFESMPDAHVHFIGHLQRNKVRKALELASVVHSVDSERLFREIASRVRTEPSFADRAPPAFYLEANISNEEQKTGATLDTVRAIAELARNDELLAPQVRGLMGMAARTDDPQTARSAFRALRELRDRLVGEGFLVEGAGLSMGMSADFEIAVEEGATIVRIGSVLYR